MRLNLCLALIPALVAASGCAPIARQAPSRVAALPAIATSGSNLPGKKSDGSVLLPNQWSLRPAGFQIELRDFPISMAVHSQGRFVAVLHSGYSAHQVSIVDLKLGK